MSYCVYKLENDRNELYFGMTKNPDKRWIDHMINARNNRSCSSKRLWYDDNAVIQMHDEYEWFETEQEAHEREKELIQNNNCVNVTKYDYDKKAHSKEYYQKNKEATLQQAKQHYEKNKQVILQKSKDFYEKNKEKIKTKTKAYGQKNKEVIAEKNKQKIVCDICGSLTARGHISRHKKSARCKSYLPTK